MSFSGDFTILRRWLVAATVAGGLGLAACSASPTIHSAKTSTPHAPSPSTPRAPTTTTTVPSASNLLITNQIRSQLVAAGAALNSLPASAYTGLVQGETFYVYDPTTGTYWAGAGLVPSSSSTQAQISIQDDGAYLLFDRTSGGTWKAYDVGLAGTSDGTPCSVTVPSSVLRLWNWAPGSCRPSTIS